MMMKHDVDGAKNFDVLATNFWMFINKILTSYRSENNKIKFLDISAKLFFPCINI